MSGSGQDNEFSFDWAESEIEKKKPKRNKRFTRSVYSKTTGAYVGEYGLFFPLFCTIIGLCFFGIGIFGFFSTDKDVQIASIALGTIAGGACNLLGFFGLSAYFSGKIGEKWSPPIERSGVTNDYGYDIIKNDRSWMDEDDGDY